MESKRMNQAPSFSSKGELANLVLTSNLIHVAWAKIHERSGHAALPGSVQPEVYHLTDNRTIVVFVPPPDSTQYLIPDGGDLITSDDFKFLRTQEGPSSVSISRAALTLFGSFDHTGLKAELIAREGQLIITGHSLGGSVASLFTLYLLDSMDKKSKCRPICITFGSPLIGNFGLQHSHWNSFFLHVVSNKDPVPGLFLPSSSSSGRSPASSHSQPQPTAVHKPFGTYLFCSELGCACFDDPDLILKLLTVMSSSEVAAGGSQCVDYGEILRNLKNRAVGKGPHLVSERFPDPFSAGILMELETALGIDRARVHSFLSSSDISRMEVEARSLARKTKAFDAKKLNDIKKDMAQLEWYKKRSKDTNRGYYDSFKNEGHTRDVTINTFMGHLTTYWEDMVAQAERKPQKEGASFRTGWLFAGTTYRRMVEPLDIAMFYGDGRRDYINSGRSKHYQLLQQWYEEKVAKPPSKEELDSKRQKVSDLLTEDSCFWAHVEEAILSCQLLKNPSCTPEQKQSSEGSLVKFGEYVMQQIDKYAVSPEIFLRESSFMKWWLLYEDLIETSTNRSRLADFMKSHSYRQYG